VRLTLSATEGRALLTPSCEGFGLGTKGRRFFCAKHPARIRALPAPFLRGSERSAVWCPGGRCGASRRISLASASSPSPGSWLLERNLSQGAVARPKAGGYAPS